jgi:SAM-dependent methyltransferase
MAERQRWITARDLERSQTTHMLDYLFDALRPLEERPLSRLLDIGCGFGGLTRLVAERLGIDEAHGIDVDGTALEEAQTKGVVTHCLEVGAAPLPFDEGFFDLVASFGMLDYLPDFDPPLREVHRILRPGGYALISLPNLAGWQNRLSLLLGYQLRDVEVSSEKVVGVHPWYASDNDPVGHIHTVTVPAFCELMEHYGFETVRVTAGIPGGRRKNGVIRWMDALLSRRVTLARRFFYLGRRAATRRRENNRGVSPGRAGGGELSGKGLDDRSNRPSGRSA